MYILPPDTTNFKSGSVVLKNIQSEKIKSIEAISKLAKDADTDVFIVKNMPGEYIPSCDTYSVFVSKVVPIMTRQFFRIGSMLKQSVSSVVAENKASENEVSVKLYNAFIYALEQMRKNC